MALQRQFGRNRNGKKFRACLICNAPFADAELKDRTFHTCKSCGQVHLVDKNQNRICLTVAEWPELRRGLPEILTPEEARIKECRQRLIRKVARKGLHNAE